MRGSSGPGGSGPNGAAMLLPDLGLGQQPRPSVPRATATCQAWTWPPHHDPHWGRGGCSADGLGDYK